MNSTVDHKTIRRIVIVGGGTAGWMAAAMLAERYQQFPLQITLIESDEIGRVGVGEATVPGIIKLHSHLGIRESDFIRATGATFKLGIEFQDWRQKNSRFFHPFAAFGAPIAGQAFFQCWLKLQLEGRSYPLEDFCLSAQLARAARFAQPDDEATTPLALYSYAYHFDATRYAQFLRQYAQERRVTRVEGRVCELQQHDNGFIKSVRLSSGQVFAADLFIDCSGFRGLLIEQCLHSGFEDWSHWLPCDSAVTVQSEASRPILPYTRSIAQAAGWQWRIPLQERIGNGYVYCSRFISDAEAQHSLLKNIDTAPVNEARLIRFNTGMRQRFWVGNCVSVGLASGFIEPLESTSISLIQTGLEKLLQFLPELVLDEANIEQANRLNRLEYERVRDFIILHYHANQRFGEAFWDELREMNIPDTLREKIQHFRRDGQVKLLQQESFVDPSWQAIFSGLGVMPQRPQASAVTMDSEALAGVLEKMRMAIARGVEHAPLHEAFLAELQ